MRRGTGTRFGARAATSGALAALCILGLASPAGASAGPAGPAAGRSTRPAQVLRLRAMPAGTVTFGRQHGRLTVHAVMSGLTPGLPHSVNLLVPGRSPGIQFSALTANSLGQATATLRSRFSGRLPHGTRLVIHLGAGGGRAGLSRSRSARAGPASAHRGDRPPCRITPTGRR
jgi:hypothetical protein